MRYSLLALGALVASVLAAPSTKYVRHEKRDRAPAGWWKTSKLEKTNALPMKIALTQSNIHKLEDYLMEVSHPTSEKFGKHWSSKQVADTFAPSKETVDTVRDWLISAGIPAERISQSQSMGWLNFDATVEEAESLLKTEYHLYEHDSGKPHVACSEYHVPEHVKQHIDFITPTVHFDAKIHPPTEEQKRKVKRAGPQVSGVGAKVTPGTAKQIGLPGSASLPKQGAEVDIFGGWAGQLATCNQFITPDCLRALYLIPFALTNVQKNPFGIVEYTPQAFLQTDLNLFFANFSKNQVQRTPIEDLIDGAVIQTQVESFEYNGESDLDLEYGMTLVNPITVTLYQVGDLVEGASFNNFLDAIDGSYCTFEGGDDPTQDAVYPDPYGGYQGPENCGGFAATKVISTSYAYNEADLTPFYEMRQCQEYAKLGIQGTTVLYSSGDYGVAGNGGQCIDPTTGQYTNGTYGKFNPSFPGTCPYITSVGATQIKPGASVTQPEEACETVIYSGGGFSNVFPMPSYQAAAVQEFFANHNPPYGSDRYNNSRMTRGFPDISANGANYVIAIDGAFNLVYGTSASCPVSASIFTIINEARAVIGKGSVGFVNPTLYAHPYVLNDITQGGNQGCGTPGFMAVPGWVSSTE